MRTVALLICTGTLFTAYGQDGGESKEVPSPTLPFYDWGACPCPLNTKSDQRPSSALGASPSIQR